MRTRRLLLLLFFISFSSIAQQYSIRQFSVLDGLPQSQVNMVLEDKNGYLWIGTHGGGLARFDGRDFKVYTTRDGLLSNIVNYLKLDSRQNLWIVHPRGITKFDGVSFKSFQPTQPNAFRRVRRVFELNDSVFFMSNQGMLGKIHEDSIYYWDKPVRKDKIIRYAHLLPTKDIALYLNDSSFLIYTPRGAFKVKHANSFSHLVNIYNVGHEVWLETDRGRFLFDFRNKRFQSKERIIENHVVQYDSSRKIFWTRQEDNLLKESWSNGVHRIDTVLRDINISQVFVDSEGNTWFGSSGNGLYKYFIQDFDRCASRKLTEVYAILKDQEGTSWIGSGNKGLWKMKNGSLRKYDLSKVTDNGITSLAQSPSGEIWAGAFGGLGRYVPEQDEFRWYTRTDGLSSPYINQLDFDAEGKLWFATNGGGVGMFSDETFSSFSVEEGLLSRNAMSIRYFSFDHSVFVGTDNGLNVIRDKKVLPVPIANLENTNINSLACFRSDKLLIGSGGLGVIVYDVQTSQTKTLDTDIGLPSDFIYFVGTDEEGLIWVGTEKGITKIRLGEDLEIEEILHYGFDNGLAGVETNANAYYLGDQKFFGLIDGIYQYNDLRNEGWKSFDLHLTNVDVFNGETPIRQYGKTQSGFFKIPENLILPSDKNHLTFHFNRVDKRYPKSVRYQFFLQGWDNTWSLPTTSNYVTYSNLPHGSYEFQVKATNNKGSWQVEPLKYAFVIRAPFYQTSTFQVLLLILVAATVGLFFFYRVRSRFNKMVELQHIRQQEQDSLRKEIARDFHDEMGNQLSRIINYVSQMKLTGNGNTSGLYDKVEESAKNLYTGTRDFIWSIDPVNDELNKLFIHIRDFADKLFGEKDIHFRAFNEVKENKVNVPYGFSREVNLIFKEAMTNSFNHSKAKNVSFTLKQEGAQFELILTDDGLGFDLSEVQKVNGLRNMQNRADRMGLRFEVTSERNVGTRVVVRFSINKSKIIHELTI